MINHHSHEFSRDAKSVECLTMRVHLVSESPKPARAPYRDAIVWQKHISSKNPIQLKKNATATIKISCHILPDSQYIFVRWVKKCSRKKAVKNVKSVPSRASPSVTSASIARTVNGCWPLIPPGCSNIFNNQLQTNLQYFRIKLIIYYQMNLWMWHWLALQSFLTLYFLVTR